MTRPVRPQAIPQTIVVRVPLAFRRRSGRKEIQVITPDRHPGPVNECRQQTTKHDPLTVAVARAYRWQELLDRGRYTSISALTRDLKVDFGYVSRLLQLTLLAPDIIEAILNGDAPSGLCLDKLQWRLPLLWSEQRQLLGFSPSRRTSTQRARQRGYADGS